MRSKKIVITGLGILSSCGIGRAAFYDNIFSGRCGIGPVSLFDVSQLKVRSAAQIKDFNPQQFLGPKGLRNLDRSTKLIMSAARLCLDDGGLAIGQENSRSVGISVGTTLGSLASIMEFDTEGIREGPNFVNPALFPNTVINSPASQVSIKFNIKGFNATISNGFTASLDAIDYGRDMLCFGKARYVLAGGVEELCLQTFMGFYKSGCLAPVPGGEGLVLGEGAGLVLMEEMETALERKARIFARVSGFGAAFDSCGINRYNPSCAGLAAAMRSAIEDAGLGLSDIDLICSGANFNPDGDAMEARAIKEVFGGDFDKPAISCVKSMTGECFSASGIIQLAAALAAIERNELFPSVNMKDSRLNNGFNLIIDKAVTRAVNNVLINNFGPTGCNSSLIVSRL